MADPNPIQTSETYETQINSLNISTKTNTLNINTEDEINNINSQILLKKDQLIKMKNEKLNNQIKNLQDYESSIINKNRLIDETNAFTEKNNTNIIILSVSIILAIILLLIISLYVYNKLNANIFNMLLIFIIICYVILLMYGYNILYFQNIVNYFKINKAQKIENAVKNWSNFTKTDLQLKLYGSKSEWDDANCNCTEDSEGIYSSEENVSVNNIPGYFYYDGNAPKQLIVGNKNDETIIGGAPVNVGTVGKPIYDKINWVDHDFRSSDEEGVYELNSPKNIPSSLVGNSTYTSNL